MNSKPSKSARKRETLALQQLGERLLDLTPEQLSGIGLEDELLTAVLAAKSMHARGALRRQKQLIGKLMRHTDPGPVTTALDAFSRSARVEKEIFRQAEDWRERLTRGSSRKDCDQALESFFATVGNTNKTLADALKRWRSAANDDTRKRLKRIIFREVHSDLASNAKNGMQNGAGSI